MVAPIRTLKYLLKALGEAGEHAAPLLKTIGKEVETAPVAKEALKDLVLKPATFEEKLVKGLTEAELDKAIEVGKPKLARAASNEQEKLLVAKLEGDKTYLQERKLDEMLHQRAQKEGKLEELLRESAGVEDPLFVASNRPNPDAFKSLLLPDPEPTGPMAEKVRSMFGKVKLVKRLQEKNKQIRQAMMNMPEEEYSKVTGFLGSLENYAKKGIAPPAKYNKIPEFQFAKKARKYSTLLRSMYSLADAPSISEWFAGNWGITSSLLQGKPTPAAKELLEIYHAMPKFEGTVYRGVWLAPDTASGILEDGRMVTDTFRSFTKDRGVADRFLGFNEKMSKGRVPTLVEVENGVGADLSKLRAEEAEILLAPGEVFDIVDAKVMQHPEFGKTLHLKVKKVGPPDGK